MHSVRWIASVGLCLLPACAPAFTGQRGMPAVRVGESISDRLAPDDPSLGERGPFRAFRLEAAERSYLITLRSSDFDAFLRVARVSGGLTDFLVEDDDGGGAKDAQIRFRPPAPGPYLLVAQAFDGGSGGFTLEVQEMANLPLVARAIETGQRITGALSNESPILERRSTRYDVYTLQARAGQKLRITLTADDFDPYLIVGQRRQGEFAELASDDDSGPGLHSLLTFEAPESGEYQLRVTSARRGQTGAYTLRVVEPGGAAAATAVRPVRLNQDLAGTLADTDPTLDEGQPYHRWSLAARQGEPLLITLRSADFDTYLAFGRVQEGEFAELRGDDDGGDGTNSRLLVTAPESGEYLIQVRGYGQGATGAYVLRVAGAAPEAAALAPRQPLRLSQEVTGTLDDGDPMLEDGSRYDDWLFTARANERLTFTLRSDAFDSYLGVGQIEQGRFVELSSNDDAPGGQDGTNSRLVLVTPAAGEYVVRVNSFGPGQSGPYTLKVEPGR